MKKNINKIVIGALSLTAIVPKVTKAAGTDTLKDLIDNFADIIGTSVIALLSGAALATFIFGVIRMMAAQGDANKLAEGKKWLVWGIIGMGAIVGLWGIIAFISSVFGIGLGGTANSPAFHIQ